MYQSAYTLVFFSSRNIIDVVNNNELGARTVSPSFIKSTQYNNRRSETVPVFPNMVMLSPILKGLVIARYILISYFQSGFVQQAQ
ncbi:MAG TPA: hypothetical protein VE089_05065 [Nitrososphaeraceae archaeon]|jgi:hypothetical protein|nr:hypothetical protein [Nitrososphaeraceae archaeon]